MDDKKRCGWANPNNQAYIEYHDTEWGRPLHDDKLLFRLLCLEGAQAGLTWEMILNRRGEYDQAYWNFDPDALATVSALTLMDRMNSYGVVKNKLKTLCLSKNARGYTKIVAEHGSFDKYLWAYVNNETVVNVWDKYQDAPTSTPASEAMSKSLKKYGFTFVGPTICYAFMQAAGLVSDHEKSCFLATKLTKTLSID
jgi:DNA-3-methyladenine glycosylase I